ncbi:MAG: YifB family Mg chelatase-like AAA ATPase [Bacteroidales bacterium]|nr:YifB family Mg chelatase-like AAA ATPase [Bacteroidales bacterium]
MLINVYSARCVGIEAGMVTVEVDVVNGIGIHLVGLADAAVKESLLRTTTALTSLGYHIPGRKIVINLAPADLHKKGSGYDLPIAIGIIAASGQQDLPCLKDFLMLGELGLDGSVRAVPGVLPVVELAKVLGFRGCIVPSSSANEAAELGGIDIYGVETLQDVVRILSGGICEDLVVRNAVGGISPSEDLQMMDFSEIIGQEGAKRGLEIAAAGGHNLIMIGPPGCGKSSLAKALAGILPPMTVQESVETSKIYSVAGRLAPGSGLMRQRPFRSPHPSASVPAMIGGGSDNIQPGEISLAHNGVLFMDEFCEMPKRMVEILRAPMEDRKVTVSRLKSKVEFPAAFMLVAATNPCPCGFWGERDRCTCIPSRRIAYISKLSGPLMDRIDLHLPLHIVDTKKMVAAPSAEKSAVVAARVQAARKIQEQRLKDEGITTNAGMTNRMIQKYCPLDKECQEMLESLIDRSGLSMRAFYRIIKVARTIADLDGAENILPEHIVEAAGYRFLDRISQLEG